MESINQFSDHKCEKQTEALHCIMMTITRNTNYLFHNNQTIVVTIMMVEEQQDFCRSLSFNFNVAVALSSLASSDLTGSKTHSS